MKMDVLLYNSKDEVIAVYTPNNQDYKNGDVLPIGSKKHKVVDIEKYRLMGGGEFVALGVEQN